MAIGCRTYVARYDEAGLEKLADPMSLLLHS